MEDSDDRLSKICQASLFFSLASAIVLKMEVDSSYTVLTYLLTVMLGVPPVLAFVFESDVDFETFGASHAKQAAGKCFAPVGRFLERCFKAASLRQRDSRLTAPTPEFERKVETGAAKEEQLADDLLCA